MLCTIWKYIVLVRIVLKTCIGLRLRHLVNTGYINTIPTRTYISILYITLYNNLLLLHSAGIKTLGCNSYIYVKKEIIA